MRYRVELNELEGFVEKLQAFEQHAEAAINRIDQQIAQMHTSWSGDAADAHRAQHDEWVAAARQMHEAVVALRTAAKDSHRNYSEAVDLNLAMLT